MNPMCVLQRRPESPGAQPIRDYKGQSRQMITMAFLEEGGYFDVPIQVGSAIISHCRYQEQLGSACMSKFKHFFRLSHLSHAVLKISSFA